MSLRQNGSHWLNVRVSRLMGQRSTMPAEAGWKPALLAGRCLAFQPANWYEPAGSRRYEIAVSAAASRAAGRAFAGWKPALRVGRAGTPDGATSKTGWRYSRGVPVLAARFGWKRAERNDTMMRNPVTVCSLGGTTVYARN
jgi:hypothetical protein